MTIYSRCALGGYDRHSTIVVVVECPKCITLPIFVASKVGLYTQQVLNKCHLKAAIFTKLISIGGKIKDTSTDLIVWQSCSHLMHS